MLNDFLILDELFHNHIHHINIYIKKNILPKKKLSFITYSILDNQPLLLLLNEEYKLQ
jgi:hypothetical protein